MIYCVDLDGTMIPNDMSVTSFFEVIKKNPLKVFPCLIWYIKGGRALLKYNLEKLYSFNVSDLNFNQKLISFLNTEFQKPENEIYLVSGSTYLIVKKIADNFEFFKGAYGSSSEVNLIGNNKLAFINEQFKDQEVCYIGNSKSDFKVWKGVPYGVVISDNEEFINDAKRHTKIIEVFSHCWVKED